MWAGQNFGSAGWTVAGGYVALELVGTKLYRAAAAYERLPNVRPPLLPVAAVPEAVLAAAEAAMYLLLPTILLATTLLVRPRNRSADVAAGLITAVTFFTVAFGWWSVYSEAVVAAGDDLSLLAGSDARILERYPDLAAVPPADRREVLAGKAQFDLAMGIPRGVLLGMFLSVALTVPASVALMSCAGSLVRRDPRVRVVVPLYFEMTLPGLVFCGYLFLLGQRVLLYGVTPQYPLCYAGLLVLCGLAAGAAAGRTSWPVRAALQVAWLGYYVVSNAYTCYEF
ncbi:MAG: hypothetical protein JWO38_7565 [Gemmataceae bacterium]|nr:hypothetical protein [Gemmataceae bacterium]